VPPPTRQRLPEPVLVPRRHPDERWRARTAVQILVGAPDGEVGIGAR
jgi:hypothetical protein